MLGILSSIMAIYGVGMAGAFVGTGVKSLVDSGNSSDSDFENIPIRKRKSCAGEAKLAFAFYYTTDNKYIARVECEKLNASEFISEDTLSSLEKRIGEVFADFDRRVAEI